VRGLPYEVKSAIRKARESALLAVETYNRPGTAFRSGAYIVLMVVAWTALFHAIFLKRHVRPFHIRVRQGRYVRYEKVDGENKAWELAECVRQFYKDNHPPARKNLEFFIGLRNKIEHRSMPQLDDQIFGECQALLLNFEALLRTEFGEPYSLNESLAVSLQFSTITPLGKAEALRRLHTKAYSSVNEYVSRFRSSLSADTQESLEYSYRVFLLPKTGNHAKSSHLAVEFINVRDLDDQARDAYERTVTLLKTRERAVAYPGAMKPSIVAHKVEQRLGLRFSTYDHTTCWKHFRVRPPVGATDKADTDIRYCHYDEPHDDYVYTDEWVDFLVSELSNQRTHRSVLGRNPEGVSNASVADSQPALSGSG